MIELALYKFLSADALVANLTNGRIYPLRAPQALNAGRNTFPRLVYQRIATERVGTTDGRTYLAKAIIQLSCWGQGPTGYQDAKILADAVRKAKGGDQAKPVDAGHAQLDGFKGTMAGVTVQGAFLEDDQDDFDPPAHDDDLGAYRTSMNVTIWWTELAL